MRLAARDRTDAAIAKPEPPFVRVDELGGQFPGMPGAPSHGQNRGLAVGAADQAPRACDSAHGLTGKERAISRLVAPGSRVTSEPDPTTVSRSAPFIRSEPCVCRRVRGWDQEMLWGRRRGDGTIVAVANRWSAPMPQPNDLSRSLVALDQDSTIIAVVEMSQSSWLVAGMLPGIERQPRKKLEPSAERLLGLCIAGATRRSRPAARSRGLH